MTIKDYIKQIPIVGQVARVIYSGVKRPDRSAPSYWIQRILPRHEGIAVQIGSNDGRTGDPLHDWLKCRNGWSAVFVEPVPLLFARLKETYSGYHRFSFENTVVNSNGSEVIFYWVSEDAGSALPNLPWWHDQLGGFNRDHITNHLPELEPFIKSSTLPGITLMGLFERHRIRDMDLLHIDTEGADWMILRQLDLKRYRPRVILYERKHLSQSEERSSILFLQGDCALYNLGADILAISKEANNAMQATLKPLRGFRVPDL